MGALHAGHLSLVKLSKRHTDVTVVSIFVNPTQFGPSEDFSKYPRTLETDARLLADVEVDYLFVPEASDIYPSGDSTIVEVESLSHIFEGAIRPTHFRGVATVVSKLFNIVQPNVAYFGQKDAQQVAVIKRMVRDMLIPIEIEVGPTIRETDQLALSSRNRFLSDEERSQSIAVSAALREFASGLEAGIPLESARLETIHRFNLAAPEAVLDYLTAVDSETFAEITSFELPTTMPPGVGITIIIAARFGATRLIDNLPVHIGMDDIEA